MLDPAAFSGAAAFAGQMDGLVGLFHANPPADPLRPVRLPGERGLLLRRQQLKHGMVLKDSVLSPLRSWAQRLGVPDSCPAAIAAKV